MDVRVYDQSICMLYIKSYMFYAQENIPPPGNNIVLNTIGHNTINMIKHMPRQSPFKQQLIPPITAGLSSQQAASALDVTRQTVSSARRKYSCLSSDCMFPSSTPNILTTAYPLGVTRTRKLHEKHDAMRWLKDNLPVKSGSAHEVYTQHDSNYQLYEDYTNDIKQHDMSK